MRRNLILATVLLSGCAYGFAGGGLPNELKTVAVLPFEVPDYATDFASDASRQEFNELLAAADEVLVMPADPGAASREAAYERAGLAVLDGCDLLLALWDGAPGRGRGGTADLVAEARRRGHPVEVIAVEREQR